MRFFSFLLLARFPKKKICMIVWFWYQIISSCLVCYKLNISLLISQFLQKMHHSSSWKTLFRNYIFLFFLTLYYISAWLYPNSMIEFSGFMHSFSTNARFSVCFLLLMCIIHIFLSYNSAKSFSIFPIFLAKMAHRYELKAVFWIWNCNFRKISYINIFIVAFYERFIVFSNKLRIRNFSDIVHLLKYLLRYT